MLYPRLWAEEGKYYYSALQNGSFFDTLSLVVRGNFQLLTNWISYFSTLTPAKYAAYTSTYLSLMIACLFIGLFGLLSIQRKYSFLLSVVAVVIFALIPQGYEIYLTGTNIQWILPVCILHIFIIYSKNWSCINKVAAYILVVISGLTGVTSVMLAPIFFLRGLSIKSQFHYRSGWILAACALLHLFIILQNSHEGRIFPTDLYILTFPVLLQSMWSPIIGVEAVNATLYILNNFKQNLIWVGLIYFISITIALFVVWTSSKGSKDRFLPLFIFGAAIYISILNIIGSIGDPNGLVSGWGGGRYFFFGSVCFVLLLIFSVSNLTSLSSKLACVILVTIMISSIIQVVNGDWKNWLITGQSWQETVIGCGELRPCEAQVWPGGSDWKFELTKK